MLYMMYTIYEYTCASAYADAIEWMDAFVLSLYVLLDMLQIQRQRGREKGYVIGGESFKLSKGY